MHNALGNKRKFTDWIKQRIEQYGFIENKIPHSNLIGAIARELGYKISYKHYYEDEYIAIIKYTD